MRFSIVVPTYDRIDMLKQCVTSLSKLDYPTKEHEIITIDDGSTDGTSQYMENLKIKNLKIIKSNHKGAGYARNLGLKEAKGEFIVFTDDDCIVEKDWLNKFEDNFKKTDADAIGGSIINPTKSYIAEAQYLLNFSSWLPGLKGGEHRDIPTANAAYKKASIKGIKFPEDLPGYGYEDTVFNHRLREKGRKILFCPEITVEHHAWEEDYGLKKFFRIQKKAAIGFNNRYRVHGPIGKILSYLGPLNLICPRLLNVAYRCIRAEKMKSFIKHLPLIASGELYSSWLIMLRKMR